MTLLALLSATAMDTVHDHPLLRSDPYQPAARWKNNTNDRDPPQLARQTFSLLSVGDDDEDDHFPSNLTDIIEFQLDPMIPPVTEHSKISR